MARGGKRVGAGRPKGNGKSVYEKAKANLVHAVAQTNLVPFIDEAVARLTPLQMMQIGAQVAFQAGDFRLASQLAKEVAPYVHPRLQNITLNADIKTTSRELTMEELEAQIASLNIIDADIIEPEDGE